MKIWGIRREEGGNKDNIEMKKKGNKDNIEMKKKRNWIKK